MKRTTKYVGLDVHQASTVAVVREETGRILARSIFATEEDRILEFFGGIRGAVHVAFEEGTQAQWLYDLLKPRVHRVVVCDRRGEKKQGNKADDGMPNASRMIEDGRPVRRRHKPMTRGLNRNHNRILKNVFKGAATAATARPGPLRDFYQGMIDRGMAEELTRVALARKMAAITLRLWKKGEFYDPTPRLSASCLVSSPAYARYMMSAIGASGEGSARSKLAATGPGAGMEHDGRRESRHDRPGSTVRDTEQIERGGRGRSVPRTPPPRSPIHPASSCPGRAGDAG